MSAPHIDRMTEEHDQLFVKIEKLDAFLAAEICTTLPEEDQRLLSAQRGVMSAYFQILSLRLQRATCASL